MQTIFETLKNGTGKERLAVISDLVSIIGVSIASVVGGIFAITSNNGTGTLYISQIIFASIIILISLAGAVLFFAIIITIFHKLNKWQPEIRVVRSLVIVSIYLLLATLLIIASWFYYELFSSFTFFHSK